MKSRLNKCHLPVHHCTDPLLGAAYSNMQDIQMESIDVFSSLHSNMTACGVMMKTEGSMLLFPLCSLKTLYLKLVTLTMRIVFLIVLDYHCNIDATAMITNILYCVL